MATFLEYLRSLKTCLSSLGPSTELCLTCGNESCDLDSVASALVYAHYHSQGNPSGEVSIPLVQCRRDLPLKQDIQLLFRTLGIDSSGLCYLDDIAPATLSLVGNLSLVLVDHNAPTGMLESYSSEVIKVIDHHHESPDSVAHQPGVSTTLEMVGSCSSLVTEELVMAEEYLLEPPAATLLLSAVLLDTGNLKVASRTTGADKFAVKELMKLLPSSFNRDNHFRELCEARFDVSKLSVKQALECDYKQCSVNQYRVGFSTVTTLLSDFLATHNVNSDFMEFQSSLKLDVLIVLGVSMSGPGAVQVTKQIAVFQPEGLNSEFSQSIANMLEAEESLRCERVEQVHGFTGFLFDQRNPDMCRKDVLPLVTVFIESIDLEYPKTGLSPSHVVLKEAELTRSAGVASSEQPYPLEPNITILSGDTPDVPPLVVAPVSASEAETTPIPEYTSTEEFKERRARRYVSIGGEEISINMDIVEPYKKIIQHAGYISEKRQALVVISACYLPPRSLPNYSQVIHHTFYYVLSVLDKLIVDDYVIVYLHSGVPPNSVPSIPILHRFYKNIDRRLRKQLTQLFIVHPTFWVKTILRLSRPFISKKFWRKVHFISILQDLPGHVQLGEEYISAPVAAMDKLIMARRPSSHKYITRQEAKQSSATTGHESADNKQQESATTADNKQQESATTTDNKKHESATTTDYKQNSTDPEVPVKNEE